MLTLKQICIYINQIVVLTVLRESDEFIPYCIGHLHHILYVSINIVYYLTFSSHSVKYQ